MSMIYGFINLDGRPADPRILGNMGAALSNRNADAHTTLVNGSVAMGFKNQYITRESHFEALPYFDAETGLYFVCDAIVDNREELARLLGLKLTNETPDGLLIFESYKKWREGCTKYLLGDFAFVVYDSKSRRVQFFRDHMGKRILNYRIENYTVFFSTLVKPLLDPQENGEKSKLNEEYLVFFLAIPGVQHEISPGTTIYQDINTVSPASCLSFTSQSVSNKIYWDPCTIHTDRRMLKTDYVEELKSIFHDAVKCRLRADGEIGSFLSGGLDSSAVACVAASILRDENKKLHTYTSVPLQGFTNWAPKYAISDESGAVKLTGAAYPNMITHFIDTKGRDPLSDAGLILDVLEQPYKFIDNSFWLRNIFKTAGRDGCKVLLSGSFGNSTISYGGIDMIMLEHLMRLRLNRFIKDVNAFCFNNKQSRRKVLTLFAGELLKSNLCFGRRRFAENTVKQEYLEKYGVESKLRLSGFSDKTVRRDKTERRLLLAPMFLNQDGFMKARFGIDSEICERDPTGDKRVVEFCLRLPYDCYFDKESGLDRGLIRRAMLGVVPAGVLKDRRRGLQAADWRERIEPRWDSFINDFLEELKRPKRLNEYLDIDRIEDLGNSRRTLTYDFDTISDVRKIIIIDNCTKFDNML